MLIYFFYSIRVFGTLSGALFRFLGLAHNNLPTKARGLPRLSFNKTIVFGNPEYFGIVHADELVRLEYSGNRASWAKIKKKKKKWFAFYRKFHAYISHASIIIFKNTIIIIIFASENPPWGNGNKVCM